MATGDVVGAVRHRPLSYVLRASSGRHHLVVRVRARLARDRAWPRGEERRNCEQHADVPYAAAVPGKRLRADRDMPEGLRQFAEYQPFTPVTETLRGLLTGTGIGTNAIVAVAWSVGVVLVSYLWARSLYKHRLPR